MGRGQTLGLLLTTLLHALRIGAATQVSVDGARVRTSLAPFAINAMSDPRAYQTAIQFAYKAMSPAVREALGWDESMIEASRKLVESSEQQLGPTDEKSLLEKFLEHLEKLAKGGRERGLLLDRNALILDADLPPQTAPDHTEALLSGGIYDQRV